MIRSIKIIFPLSFLLFFLTNCKSDNDEELMHEATLSANPAMMQFDAAGGEKMLNVFSNTAWVLQHDPSSWATPALASGEGTKAVAITAEANESEDSRSATITLSADGADDVVITLNQAGKEPGEPVDEEPVFEDYIEPDNTGMRELTAIELSQLMGLGWNLGNSLEAILVNNGVYSGNETSWGNPAVNQALIDAVKDAGFNAVRIPVSWSHQIQAGTNNKIRLAWLQRVEEVVNYVLDNDMYAIINIHWDGGWMNHPDYDNQDAINDKLDTLWKQIAVYFRDYDDHLLFAGTNEVHVENDWGAPSAENAEVQNSFNQTFVDAVRATGGRNTYRHLVVQGYNTNIGHTVDYFEIPDDPTDDRLMVEVHFYDPYDFALMEEGEIKTQWGAPFEGGDVSNWGQEDWVDEAFGLMKTNFIDAGYPVILGEYGALLRANLSSGLEEHVEARNYYLEYVTRAALDNGMVPFYWDNGYAGNNGFGLFNRSTGTQEHADAIEAIQNGAGEEE